MSALNDVRFTPKADIGTQPRDVRFVPIADIGVVGKPETLVLTAIPTVATTTLAAA